MYISDMIVYKFIEYFPCKKIGIIVHQVLLIHVYSYVTYI